VTLPLPLPIFCVTQQGLLRQATHLFILPDSLLSLDLIFPPIGSLHVWTGDVRRISKGIVVFLGRRRISSSLFSSFQFRRSSPDPFSPPPVQRRQYYQIVPARPTPQVRLPVERLSTGLFVFLNTRAREAPFPFQPNRDSSRRKQYRSREVLCQIKGPKELTSFPRPIFPLSVSGAPPCLRPFVLSLLSSQVYGTLRYIFFKPSVPSFAIGVPLRDLRGDRENILNFR